MRQHEGAGPAGRRSAGPVSRLGRLRRRLGFDRNELRRRVDRVQWSLGLGLLAVFVLLAPLAAGWAGLWAHHTGARIEQQERAARHQVVATVVAPPGVGGNKDRYLHQTVQATWQAPNGTPRTGQIPAWKNVRPGATHRMWVDGTGKPVPRPRPHSRTLVDTGYAATGAMLAVGLPLLLAYALIRRRCDQLRGMLWDEEWARIDPHRIS
jgi:hypothetical protein